jgi:hypothetical protein
MFGLHSGQIVLVSGNEIVPSSGKFKNRDVTCRPEENGLFQEVFRVAEEPIQSLCHIRLIGSNNVNFRNFDEREVGWEAEFTFWDHEYERG